ncbi:hypothetical protein GCM10010201_23510 [Pilimelia columellifera subsp. columellifera]|uniref:Uncharacterized protein n=1 Tax=Pilimelia columellifera subsp. columellifera TaxID=706583 RepID=A0ABP6AVH5_9ACTN
MFGAGVAVLAVITRSHRQMVSPPELLGRVMASVRFISWTAIPIGSMTAGAAAQVWQPGAGLLTACIGAAATLAVLLTSRVRRLRDLKDDETPAASGASSPSRKPASE